MEQMERPSGTVVESIEELIEAADNAGDDTVITVFFGESEEEE